MKKVIKILPAVSSVKNTYDDGVLRLVGISNASDVDGDVLIVSNCYNEVFKTCKKNASDSKKRLSIVKIAANGKSIYRTCRCVSATGFISDYVALSPNSIMLLNDKDGNGPKEVKLSEGGKLPFYLYHPDKAVRISFKLGLLSVLLGLVSIAISVLSNVS